MTPDEARAKQIASEGHDIAAAARINEFLQDPAVAEWLRGSQEQAYKTFLAADTDQKRRDAWAAAKAFEKLKQGVAAIQGSGQRAAESRATREADEERQNRAKSRK